MITDNISYFKYYIFWLKRKSIMEEQLKKLKTRAVITFILSLLALTWQFLNYMSVKDYLKKTIAETDSSTLMVYLSYIVFLLLFLSIIVLTFSVFRVNMKYKSEKKKEQKLKEKEMKKNEKELKQLEKKTKLTAASSSSTEISE